MPSGDIKLKLIRLINLPDHAEHVSEYWLAENDEQIKEIVHGAHGSTGSSAVGFQLIAEFRSWLHAHHYAEATRIKANVLGFEQDAELRLRRWWVP